MPTIHDICPTDASGGPALEPSSLCGAYRLGRRIAVGGVGDVYEAEHTLLGRRAALKVLQVRHADRKELGERLAQEARVLSVIRHPNMVTVYDAGILGGADSPPVLWMAMEYLEGKTLREALWPNQRLPAVQALAVARQIALGVSAAHAAGAVHRDLKPENVMLCHDGRVVVLDLGTAKYLRASKLRPTQRPMGTVAYMSPEHLLGEDVDFRSDVYSLGLVLWEMLVGYHPFSPSRSTAHLPSAMELARCQLQVMPRAVHEAEPALPGFLWQALEPALRKDPRARYADVNVLSTALQHASERLADANVRRGSGIGTTNRAAPRTHPPTRSHALPSPPQAPRRPRPGWYRHWSAALLFGSAVGALAFYGFAYWPSLRAADVPPSPPRSGGSAVPGH